MTIDKKGYIFTQVRKKRIKLIATALIVLAYTIYLFVDFATYITTSINENAPLDTKAFLSFASNAQEDISNIPSNPDELWLNSLSYNYYIEDVFVTDKGYRFNFSSQNYEETNIVFYYIMPTDNGNKLSDIPTKRLVIANIDGQKVPIMLSTSASAGQPLSVCAVKTPDVVKYRLQSEYGETTVFPYMLDSTSINIGGENTYKIFLAFFTLLTLYLFVKIIIYFVKPSLHPTYRQLSNYGDAVKIANQIEDELKSDDVKKENREIYTKNYILKNSTFKTKIVKNHTVRGRYE